MTRVTCRLTTKNQDQLRNPALGNRIWATFFTAVAAIWTVARMLPIGHLWRSVYRHQWLGLFAPNCITELNKSWSGSYVAEESEKWAGQTVGLMWQRSWPLPNHNFEGARQKLASGVSEKKIVHPCWWNVNPSTWVVCTDPQHTIPFSILLEVKTLEWLCKTAL